MMNMRLKWYLTTLMKMTYFCDFFIGETHQLTEITNLLQLRQRYFISVTTMKDNTLAQKANYNVYVSSHTFYLYNDIDYSSFINYHIFLKRY